MSTIPPSPTADHKYVDCTKSQIEQALRIERALRLCTGTGPLDDTQQSQLQALLNGESGAEGKVLDRAFAIPTTAKMQAHYPLCDKRAVGAILRGNLDISNLAKLVAALHGSGSIDLNTLAGAYKGLKVLEFLSIQARIGPFAGLPGISERIEEAIVDVDSSRVVKAEGRAKPPASKSALTYLCAETSSGADAFAETAVGSATPAPNHTSALPFPPRPRRARKLRRPRSLPLMSTRPEGPRVGAKEPGGCATSSSCRGSAATGTLAASSTSPRRQSKLTRRPLHPLKQPRLPAQLQARRATSRASTTIFYLVPARYARPL